MLFPQARAAVDEAAGDPPAWEVDVAASRQQARDEAARAEAHVQAAAAANPNPAVAGAVLTPGTVVPVPGVPVAAVPAPAAGTAPMYGR